MTSFKLISGMGQRLALELTIMAEMGGGEDYASCFSLGEHDAEIQCGFSKELVRGK
jgi:hypothetical protein